MPTTPSTGVAAHTFALDFSEDSDVTFRWQTTSVLAGARVLVGATEVENPPLRTRGFIGKLATLKLGDIEAHNLHTSVGNDPVGWGFLSHYIATFDFPGGALYLKPCQTDRSGAAPTGTGAHFVRVGRQILVVEVEPGSQAEKAGMKAGDAIVEVNGRPQQDFRLVGVRAAASGAVSPLRFTVLRGGSTQSITVRAAGKVGSYAKQKD